MKCPSPARLAELFEYHPDDGLLRWKHARGNRPAGAVAGSLGKACGYVDVGVDGGLYRAHRVIWALVTGNWPTQQIDHIDGVRSNNKWANLRDVGLTINSQNLRHAKRSNKIGLLGVSRKAGRVRDPWHARICLGSKQKHLGYFGSPEAAHEAYLRAKRAHHAGCTL